jgi:hypothetical protein
MTSRPEADTVSAMRPLLALAAATVASVTLLVAPPALAVRLPTNREAKALLAAFRHDRRVPKDAQLIDMRVSTKGAYARVDWLPASAQARAAKVKIITLHHADYAKPAKPKPAPKPPPKVKQDLDNHIHIHLTATIAGGEDAHATGSSPGDCGGSDSGTITATATFSWTEAWDIDIDSLSDSPLGFNYVSRQLTPFIGSAQDNLTSTVTDDCGGTQTITCKTTGAPDRNGLFTQITDDGVVLPAALALSDRSCSDGEAPDNLDQPRWVRTADLGFLIPLKLGVNGIVSVRDSYPVSFPKSAVVPDGPADSATLGLCKTPFDTCNDNLNYSGTVDVKVLA